MSETYRVCGSILDESDLWIDVSVTNVTLDGEVNLEEATSTDPRTWTTTTEDFNDWQVRNLAAKHADLTDPSHTIWSTLSDAHSQATESPHSGGASSMQASLTDMFTTLVYQHTQ